MLGQGHTNSDIAPVPSFSSVNFRRLVGAALGLGLVSIAASGFLFMRVNSLEQEMIEIANISGSGQEHTVLKNQLNNVNKVVQTHTSKLAATSQGIAKLNNDVSQLGSAQNVLKKEVSNLKQNDKSLLQIERSAPQDIGYGFLVKNLNAEPTRSGGIVLTGTLINAASVRHTQAVFNFSIEGYPHTSLVVPKIAASGTQSFAVEFPNVPIQEATRCRIEYEGSSTHVLPLLGRVQGWLAD